MASIASINILTDKKAKILTALKASMRAGTSSITREAAKKAREMISGESFDELYKQYGEEITEDVAIVLYDDYVTVYFEDITLDELERHASEYSAVFEKPVVYTSYIDEEIMIVGVAADGNIKTKLARDESGGDALYESDIEKTDINMDYLARYYNSHSLTDLNGCGENSDIIYALEEDYGIYAEMSPVTVTIFGDRFKVLEKNENFTVYSAL